MIKKAIYIQVNDLLKNPPENVKITVIDPNNITRLDIRIAGPEGTPYEGGLFHFEMILDRDTFPCQPPEVVLRTKIYHPNVINQIGQLDLQILNPHYWRPSIKLRKLIEELINFLKHPEDGVCHSCDPEIGYEIASNRELFIQKAKQWTEQFAH